MRAIGERVSKVMEQVDEKDTWGKIARKNWLGRKDENLGPGAVDLWILEYDDATMARETEKEIIKVRDEKHRRIEDKIVSLERMRDIGEKKKYPKTWKDITKKSIKDAEEGRAPIRRGMVLGFEEEYKKALARKLKMKDQREEEKRRK